MRNAKAAARAPTNPEDSMLTRVVGAAFPVLAAPGEVVVETAPPAAEEVVEPDLVLVVIDPDGVAADVELEMTP
jgi:hypothetical protein